MSALRGERAKSRRVHRMRSHCSPHVPALRMPSPNRHQRGQLYRQPHDGMSSSSDGCMIWVISFGGNIRPKAESGVSSPTPFAGGLTLPKRSLLRKERFSLALFVDLPPTPGRTRSPLSMDVRPRPTDRRLGPWPTVAPHPPLSCCRKGLFVHSGFSTALWPCS